MAKMLGLHVVALGSNPVLTSDQDLFPVELDSTLSVPLVNSQLVASCQLVFLIMLTLKLFLSDY